MSSILKIVNSFRWVKLILVVGLWQLHSMEAYDIDYHSLAIQQGHSKKIYNILAKLTQEQLICLLAGWDYELVISPESSVSEDVVAKLYAREFGKDYDPKLQLTNKNQLLKTYLVRFYNRWNLLCSSSTIVSYQDALNRAIEEAGKFLGNKNSVRLNLTPLKPSVVSKTEWQLALQALYVHKTETMWLYRFVNNKVFCCLAKDKVYAVASKTRELSEVEIENLMYIAAGYHGKLVGDTLKQIKFAKSVTSQSNAVGNKFSVWEQHIKDVDRLKQRYKRLQDKLNCYIDIVKSFSDDPTRYYIEQNLQEPATIKTNVTDINTDKTLALKNLKAKLKRLTEISELIAVIQKQYLNSLKDLYTKFELECENCFAIEDANSTLSYIFNEVAHRYYRFTKRQNWRDKLERTVRRLPLSKIVKMMSGVATDSSYDRFCAQHLMGPGDGRIVQERLLKLLDKFVNKEYQHITKLSKILKALELKAEKISLSIENFYYSSEKKSAINVAEQIVQQMNSCPNLIQISYDGLNYILDVYTNKTIYSNAVLNSILYPDPKKNFTAPVPTINSAPGQNFVDFENLIFYRSQLPESLKHLTWICTEMLSADNTVYIYRFIAPVSPLLAESLSNMTPPLMPVFQDLLPRTAQSYGNGLLSSTFYNKKSFSFTKILDTRVKPKNLFHYDLISLKGVKVYSSWFRKNIIQNIANLKNDISPYFSDVLFVPLIPDNAVGKQPSNSFDGLHAPMPTNPLTDAALKNLRRQTANATTSVIMNCWVKPIMIWGAWGIPIVVSWLVVKYKLTEPIKRIANNLQVCVGNLQSATHSLNEAALSNATQQRVVQRSFFTDFVVPGFWLAVGFLGCRLIVVLIRLISFLR